MIANVQFSIGNNAKWKVGYRCKINDGMWCVRKHAMLDVGDDFSINGGSHWEIGRFTSVIIGKDCMFSYGVDLWSNDGHSIFNVHTGENINSTEEICKERKIVIGNHVWVSERTIILYNAEIGNGSIIGAGSLVKGKIPNNCIAAGVPAKVIRKDVAWSREDGADRLKECEKEYACLTKEY